jgi:hypothetical protein
MHRRERMKVALASMLVIGSVSFAWAGPDRDESTARYRLDDKHTHFRHDGDWIELASPTTVKHGKEYITLNTDLGALSRLRLDATTGRPIVLTVRINFKNGTSRTARIDRVIDKKRPVAIDLKGAEYVDSVVVVTDPVSNAEYKLMGLPASAGVAAR